MRISDWSSDVCSSDLTDWVLDLSTQDDEPDDDLESGSGRMAALAPIRGELLRGDLRPLYLVWLLRVQNEDVSPTVREPDVPLGLSNLTGAQRELVDFLRIDEHLVKAAAQRSHPEAPVDFRPWIASLPVAEKDRLMLEVVEGKETHVGALMLRQYRQESKKQGAAKHAEQV